MTFSFCRNSRIECLEIGSNNFPAPLLQYENCFLPEWKRKRWELHIMPFEKYKFMSESIFVNIEFFFWCHNLLLFFDLGTCNIIGRSYWTQTARKSWSGPFDRHRLRHNILPVFFYLNCATYLMALLCQY